MKTKKQTIKFRSPFYELGDKIGQLEDAAIDANDITLQEMVQKMQKLRGEIRNHLNINYIWD